MCICKFARLSGWHLKAGHRLFTLLLVMVGYGYRPQRALWPALAIVLLGWGVVHVADARKVMLPVTKPATGAATITLVPPVYSFEAFVPIIDLGQAKAFKPDMNTRWGWWTQAYLWVHSLLGWLIGGVAAAGILGLFRRN